MATHSTAYIPTNRKPGEYIMSEGWSDGMLGSTGLYWYQSTPRMDESIRATMLLDGSPVFAPAGETGFEIKEVDYIEENVRDMLEGVTDDFLEGVGITLQALEAGDWATAESTDYAKMTFEEKKEKELTNNNCIYTITDFGVLPSEYGQQGPCLAYDQAALVEALKQYDPNKPYTPGPRGYTPDVWCWYYYHDGLKQWWGIVALPDGKNMYIPLVVGFFIEGRNLDDIKELHTAYPDVYASDISELASIKKAMDAALAK